MRFVKLTLLVYLFSFFLMPIAVKAAGSCFCSTEHGLPPLADATCASVAKADCATLPQQNSLYKKYSTGCVWKDAGNSECDAAVAEWRKANDAATGNAAQIDQQKAEIQKKKGLIRGAIADCVFADKLEIATDGNNQKYIAGDCGDVSLYVKTAISLSSALFGIIGGLALLVFVVGGCFLIISSGNPEKIKKATDMMVAAVIGLTIAFGGYLLIKFVGDALGLADQFKLK